MMRSSLAILLSVVLPTLAASVARAIPDPLAELDSALDAAMTFEYGKDSQPLLTIERIVFESAKDAKLHNAVEQRLLRALGSSGARDAKEFLCRQLRTIGTAQSVPVLENLLTDPQLSHPARYALGSIEDPAAAAALHRALGRTSGAIQVGIINTLADRRYEPARRDIAKLLQSADAQVAQASARALGRLGGGDGVKSLQAARENASEPMRHVIDLALIRCAEQFLAGGRPAEAMKLYEQFYQSGEARHLRLAGLRGLVLANGDKGVPLLVGAIQGADAELSRDAIGLAPLVGGSEATKVFAALLPLLAAESQELMVRALGSRNDPTAAPAIAAATRSDHANVRLAAVDALGNVGDASAVLPLAQAAAAAEGTEKSVARASLLRLQGDRIDTTLIQAARTGTPEARAECIRALAGRKVTKAVEMLFAAARDDNETVRHEAIRVLGALAAPAELDRLVSLAITPKAPGDRMIISRTIEAAFGRISDREQQASPLLAALVGAPPDAKPVLLLLLRKPATARALEAVRKAVTDADPQIRAAAMRSLSEWPTPEPADDLLTFMRSSGSQTDKVTALRGYVRMAGLSPDPAAMYLRAMELAQRTEDKKLVFASLQTADSVQALDLVEQYLGNEELRDEAGLAAVQIADRLRQKDATRAKAAVEKVLSANVNARIRQQAQAVINEMEKFEGYILTWMVCGPYMEKGKESRAIFDAAFAPEATDAKAVEWKPLTEGLGQWDINLEATFGGKDHCAAYARTYIWSASDQAASLELGSDDAIKAWLNDELVHANYVQRGAAPRQDVAGIKLHAGWNKLLLKVVDHEGGWVFCCRLRKPDGGALIGLKISAANPQ
jgi:HEAT repeat protein